MPVDSLSCFPASFVAGDTIRIPLSDTDYPSSTWTLAVIFRSVNDGSVKSFAATPNDDDDGFELVITAALSAGLSPGLYTVTYVYTETATGERFSDPDTQSIAVLTNPSATAPKSDARLVLEAMEAALKKLAGGSNATFSANGQSFTKKNLKDLQDAIERQKAIVRTEDGAIGLQTGRFTGIGIRFSPTGGCRW